MLESRRGLPRPKTLNFEDGGRKLLRNVGKITQIANGEDSKIMTPQNRRRCTVGCEKCLKNHEFKTPSILGIAGI